MAFVAPAFEAPSSQLNGANPDIFNILNQHAQSPFMQSVFAGLLFALASTLLLATMHGIVRHLATEMHPFVIVFFRNLFGLVAVLPLFMRTGLSALKTDYPKLHMLRVATGFFAMLSWFYALAVVPLTNATALSFSVTIFATLSAWIFLGEKMKIRRWLAIIVGFVGVIVVLRPGLDGFNSYSLLVLASTVGWGLSITIVKKLSKTDSATTIVGWMSISLTLLSLWPALVYWQWPTWPQLAALFVVGALATGGHLCMVNALQRADTTLVTTMDFCRLIWVAAIGALFFNDLLDRWTLIGAVIIFASGWYIVFRESKQPKQAN